MRTRVALGGTLLVALVAAVYSGVEDHAFLRLDDDRYITDNPRHAEPLDPRGLAIAFTPYEDNWVPLTWLSLRIDYALYGPRPAGFLVTNAALHALASLLLFGALARATGQAGLAAWVAAVFAAHPVHVESVAWASERKDVLSGVFFGATLLAYTRFTERPDSWPRYGAVLAAFAAGLLAKPMLVTVPLVLLLLDAWPLERLRSAPLRCALEKLPLLALSAGVGLVTLVVQEAAGAMRFGHEVAFELRLANAVNAVWAYLGQTVWPVGLAAFYPYPDSLPGWRVAAEALGLVALSAAALSLRRTRPELAVGWLWFGVMLVPVLGLVQVGMQSHADRYLYLPQTGLALAVAATAGRWAVGSATRGRALVIAAALSVAALAFQARLQVDTWQNDETVFRRALAVTERNYVAHHQLAAAVARAGRHDEAAHHYRAAIALQPAWPLPRIGLAESLIASGETELAVESLRAALRLDPGQPGPELRLALLLAETGRKADARVALESWVARAEARGGAGAELAVAHFGLGDLDTGAGQPEAAVEHYRRGLAIAPGQIQGRTRLASALSSLERWDEAAAELRTALELGADTPLVHAALGRAYRRAGRELLAVAHLEEAVARLPGSDAALELGWLRATAASSAVRDPEEAIRLSESRLAVVPDDPAALDLLAAGLAGTGELDLAVVAAEMALAAAEGARASGPDHELDHPEGIRRRLESYRAGAGDVGH